MGHPITHTCSVESRNYKVTVAQLTEGPNTEGTRIERPKVLKGRGYREGEPPFPKGGGLAPPKEKCEFCT